MQVTPGDLPKMTEPVHRQTTFLTQARALFLKNAAYQRSQRRSNLVIILYPVFFCVLLYILQTVINNALDSRDNQCGCYCYSCCSTNATTGVHSCRNNTASNPCQSWEDCQAYDDSRCGLGYSNAYQAGYCAIPSPSTWPALLQIALPSDRAEPWRPDATILYTGQNETASSDLAQRLVSNPDPTAAEMAAAQATLLAGEARNAVYASAISEMGYVLGTWRQVSDGGFITYYVEPGFVSSSSDERYNATLFASVENATDPAVENQVALLNTALTDQGQLLAGFSAPTVTPAQGNVVWQNSSDAINQLLYCGFRQANCYEGYDVVNEYTAAFDFLNTSTSDALYNVVVWFNGTGKWSVWQDAPNIVRVNQGINLATNAYLQQGLGDEYRARLLGFMDVPKQGSALTLDFSGLLGPLFFVWVAQLLLPSMLTNLVYEKEKRLRTIMKMHGLGDIPYWIIQYTWFFSLNFAYSLILIGIGTATNLGIFRLTSTSYLIVFYFLWSNCLVSFTFLLSTLFRSSKTAVVFSFLYTFATGLIGWLLLTPFIQQDHWWVIWFELVPGFALYRGQFEMGAYAFRGAFTHEDGMTWSSLSDPDNGSAAVLIIFAVEWVVFLVLAWYFEQIIPSGVGVTKHPLFFLGKKRTDKISRGCLPSFWKKGGADLESKSVRLATEPEDVQAERERVERGETTNSSIIIQSLMKVYPPRGGNAKHVAVRDLTMAVERGECFGLLGPNGAGKSTAINVLTGFLEPTHGTAIVEGHNIREGMSQIYSMMGVCPQDDLLWGDLSARDHLMFYGRLKGLRAKELRAAVDSALKSVNLWNGGVGDKKVKAYSGGMKRRLSVAISFIGSPSVVYLDEPSTGLDPGSRRNLWDVVKNGKKDRGIVLTTHSMEEAHELCDRLGIFVDGQLVCLGSPQELTARYADFYVFTIMTPPEQGIAAHELVLAMSPGARQTYALAGTRKYEIPVKEVTLAGVFKTMTEAKKSISILDWGIGSATLEEVFIKFAKERGLQGGN